MKVNSIATQVIGYKNSNFKYKTNSKEESYNKSNMQLNRVQSNALKNQIFFTGKQDFVLPYIVDKVDANMNKNRSKNEVILPDVRFDAPYRIVDLNKYAPNLSDEGKRKLINIFAQFRDSMIYCDLTLKADSIFVYTRKNMLDKGLNHLKKSLKDNPYDVECYTDKQKRLVINVPSETTLRTSTGENRDFFVIKNNKLLEYYQGCSDVNPNSSKLPKRAENIHADRAMFFDNDGRVRKYIQGCFKFDDKEIYGTYTYEFNEDGTAKSYEFNTDGIAKCAKFIEDGVTMSYEYDADGIVETLKPVEDSVINDYNNPEYMITFENNKIKAYTTKYKTDGDIKKYVTREIFFDDQRPVSVISTTTNGDEKRSCNYKFYKRSDGWHESIRNICD